MISVCYVYVQIPMMEVMAVTGMTEMVFEQTQLRQQDMIVQAALFKQHVP